MRIVKPKGVIGGFHADYPDPALPELVHLGEQWAPQDYQITRHSHAVWEFFLQLNGQSVWRDELSQNYLCPAGAFYAPRPRLEHWLHHTTGKHHFVYAAIDVETLLRSSTPLRSAWKPRPAVHIAEGRACESAFRTLVREVTSERPFRTAAIQAAMASLLVDVSRMVVEAPGVAQRRWVPRHPAVEAVRQTLETHLSEPWTLNDLGRLAGLSPNHLAALFAEEVGESPHRYLLRMRVERATELLSSSDAPITEIAHELGFDSSQHFARVFRTATGQTASEYRKQKVVPL